MVYLIFPRLPNGEDYAEEYALEYFLPIGMNEISDEGPILPLGCKLVVSHTCMTIITSTMLDTKQ